VYNYEFSPDDTATTVSTDRIPLTYLLVSAVSWLQRISNCHGRPPYLLSAIDTDTFLFPVTRPSLRIGSLPRKNASILASASTDTANLSDLSDRRPSVRRASGSRSSEIRPYGGAGNRRVNVQSGPFGPPRHTATTRSSA
jgi:hypothetical protein